jgi:hypothetical protein
VGGGGSEREKLTPKEGGVSDGIVETTELSLWTESARTDDTCEDPGRTSCLLLSMASLRSSLSCSSTRSSLSPSVGAVAALSPGHRGLLIEATADDGCDNRGKFAGRGGISSRAGKSSPVIASECLLDVECRLLLMVPLRWC